MTLQKKRMKMLSPCLDCNKKDTCRIICQRYSEYIHSEEKLEPILGRRKPEKHRLTNLSKIRQDLK